MAMRELRVSPAATRAPAKSETLYGLAKANFKYGRLSRIAEVIVLLAASPSAEANDCGWLEAGATGGAGVTDAGVVVWTGVVVAGFGCSREGMPSHSQENT